MKVGIVGAGAVGSACLLSLVMRGSAREVVLVNRNRGRARGLVADVQYGAVVSPTPIEVRDGDYSDLAGASVVMITAGVNEKGGGATDRGDPLGRLRLLQANTAIYEEIVPTIHSAAPDALILVVTDPPDALADVVRLLGHERVLSTGTSLDTLRFRFHLARRLKVSAADPDALVLGEHGTSEVFLWSSARVAGRKADDLLAEMYPASKNLREEIEREVRFANITIIEGIGASQYGIGMVCARLTEMVLRDERAVIPIGRYNAKFGVTLSLPSVVGRGGVDRILEPEMSDAERQGLQRSADAIRGALAQVDLKVSRRKTA
ncbi:MAG: malate dehydrogenase [Myxococcales bacterium]|nr:malate dehydrogenase [Myxococcales bacterium]